jgi:cytochrome c553
MVIRAFGLALLIGALPLSGAETDYEYCTVCHGANGNGNFAIRAPRIAGMEPWYLKSQLLAFKSGWRGTHAEDAPGNEMRPVALALMPAQIDQAIAYVASFAAKPASLTVSGDAGRGRALYVRCVACHGAKAEGKQSLHAPALAMLTDWYLVTQLLDYRRGLRGTERGDVDGQQMRAMATGLADDEAAKDVVAYIESLR